MNPKTDLLTFTRDFAAPRALVFEAWTDSKHLAHWWGPHGFTNPRCEWDFRPGGAIHVDMRGPDGTVYPMGGTVREIAPPERLVFTSGALDGEGKFLFEILNTITFAETDGSTTVTVQTEVLSLTPAAEQYLSGQEEGWSQSLERLGSLVAGLCSPAAGREIVITRSFHAPRELVWDAMTDPRHVIQWWGPRGFTTTVEEMNVCPGGAWKLTMRGPDGAEYPNKSTFTEVVRPQRICYSHGGGRKGSRGAHFHATWTFEAPAPGKTVVTIRMVFLTPEDRDRIVRDYGAIEGGRQTLERLGEHLAHEPVIVERTFDASAGTIWKALTDRDAMKEWYFELAEFRPEVGFEFGFVVEHAGTVYDHRCRIVEVLPDRKLAYTWRYEGQPGDSLVTFELTPEGDRTRVTVTHSGVHTFPLTPSYARTNFEMGWMSIVGDGLAKYLAG